MYTRIYCFWYVHKKQSIFLFCIVFPVKSLKTLKYFTVKIQQLTYMILYEYKI